MIPNITPRVSRTCTVGQPISSQYLHILSGFARGLTYEEIAKEMFLSHHTVKTHARKMYQEIGAKNAPHAVSIAYQRGYLLLSREVNVPPNPGQSPSPFNDELRRRSSPAF